MSKMNYFDQPAADLDDKLLIDAIEKKIVPLTCLLGGVLVKTFADAGVDPCSRCPCPNRDKCGGRAMTESMEAVQPAGDARFVSGESGARKVMRRMWIGDLMRAGEDAEKRRKS